MQGLGGAERSEFALDALVDGARICTDLNVARTRFLPAVLETAPASRPANGIVAIHVAAPACTLQPHPIRKDGGVCVAGRKTAGSRRRRWIGAVSVPSSRDGRVWLVVAAPGWAPRSPASPLAAAPRPRSGERRAQWRPPTVCAAPVVCTMDSAAGTTPAG
jgi:hypothetical protein